MFELYEFIYVVFPLGWKIKKLRNLFIDAEFQVLSDPKRRDVELFA